MHGDASKLPLSIGFVYTSHCNAQCGHCSTNCGPKQKAYLGEADIIRAIREAADSFPDRELQICFSGGEPLLDINKLCYLIEHAKKYASQVNCVTNAFWAASLDSATSVVQQLNRSGLTGIAVSTSIFHEKYVAPARVVNALTAAKNIGLKALLKFPTVANGEGVAEWAERHGFDLTNVIVEEFAVMPYMREGFSIPKNSYQLQTGVPSGRCPASIITYRENGEAFMCCSPGGFSDSLRIGSITENFETVFDRFALGGIQRLLKSEGPAYFISHIERAGLGDHLRQEFTSVCDLCASIFSNNDIAKVCEDVAIKSQIDSFRSCFDLSKTRTTVEA